MDAIMHKITKLHVIESNQTRKQVIQWLQLNNFDGLVHDCINAMELAQCHTESSF